MVKVFDPYVAVDIDEIPVARTLTQQKTLSPVWNEEMTAKVHGGENINFTVFHDAAIPPDEFVANCKVPFEDIVSEKTSDFWVTFVMWLLLGQFLKGFEKITCTEMWFSDTL